MRESSPCGCTAAGPGHNSAAVLQAVLVMSAGSSYSILLLTVLADDFDRRQRGMSGRWTRC